MLESQPALHVALKHLSNGCPLKGRDNSVPCLVTEVYHFLADKPLLSTLRGLAWASLLDSILAPLLGSSRLSGPGHPDPLNLACPSGSLNSRPAL